MKDKKRRFSEFIRTDLALDTLEEFENGHRGVVSEELDRDGFAVSRIKITSDAAAAKLGRPRGTYVTVTLGALCTCDRDRRDAAVAVVAEQLRSVLYAAVPNLESALIAGIGNKNITADAVGPVTTERLTVTRHIKLIEPSIFKKLRHKEVSVTIPGVIGDTGIEAAETIKSAVKNVRPDAVILIDALASKSVDRLAATVQISDTGLSPGSGVGNNRGAISEDTLGVPVIAIGVPMIVDSSTLVCEALEKAGIEEIPESLEKILENGKSFFVSIKDADAALETIAEILSAAIDETLTVQQLSVRSER